MKSDMTRAPAVQSARPSSIRILLRGKGSPRLYLRALLAGIAWGLLVFLLYPYALDIASMGGNLRYLGLGLLLLIGFAAYRAFRAFGRVIWHLGILWLIAGILIILLALTATRMRSGAAFSWIAAAESVAHDAGSWIARNADPLVAIPADIYRAATGQAPPWRPKPIIVLDPVNLDRTAEGEQVVLPSQSEPNGITRGALVRAVASASGTLSLHTSPDAGTRAVFKAKTGTPMIVVDGPKQTGKTIWWKVSTAEHEGWCVAEALALISR
jgi:hypothetical protein